MAKAIDIDLLRFMYRYQNGNLIRVSSRTRPDLIGCVFGAKRSDGYVKGYFNGSYFFAHRLIWTYFNGDIPAGYEIDHIDGNHSNNKIENLRVALPEENTQNLRGSHGDSKLGIIGVHKNGKKYIVQIKIGDKRIRESYSTVYEAENRYLQLKREHHAFCTI